ncbi:MAG: DUF2017 domain-containing protein [Actinomycetes bacterium]
MRLPFRRGRGGEVVMAFDAAEIGVLRQLLGELITLLGPEQEGAVDPLARELGLAELEGLTVGTEPVRAPDDPALARLFPDAYPGDTESSSDFRRFTQPGLASRKRQDAQAARASLDAGPGRRPVDDALLHSWLRTLTDLRLALGARLEVDEEFDRTYQATPDTDPRKPTMAVYAWLGWVQETLVRALS